MCPRGLRLRLYRKLLQCSCSRWRCWINWRTWLTVAVVITYCIILLIILPLMIYGLYELNAGVTFSAWFIAGIFVLMSIPIFLANLLQHLFNYTQPHLQAYIVRIIWIVPVYSIDSWLGLKFPSTAIYWSTVRECYESYALYNFLVYLLNFLEAEYNLAAVMNERPPVVHIFPFCCCKPWPSGRRFIRWCKVAVLQYAVLRPVLTIIALITQLANVYDEGHLRPDRSYLYISIINAISQGIALYTLAYFYKGTRDLLKPLHPVMKFTAIKAIILFTFWQAVIIALLVKANVIKQSRAWEKYGFQDVATSIQDFIICLEMLVAAIAFYFIFSHKPYIDPAAAQVPCFASCLKMMDVRDIYGDVKENFVDPIPVPRVPRLPGLPVRYSHDKLNNVVEINLEDIPLLRGNESGGEDEGRIRRLGGGEDSLVQLSVRDVKMRTTNPRHSDYLTELQEHEVSPDRTTSSSSSTTSESQDSQIRERRITEQDLDPYLLP